MNSDPLGRKKQWAGLTVFKGETVFLLSGDVSKF